jgi:O-antigen ligase
MRRIAWYLLLAFAFAVPWEYSLDLGEPLGNVARIIGLLLLLATVPAVLQPGRMRTPGPLQWLVLALYLWFCCTCFWSIEPTVSLEKMRAFFQEMMVVWMVWEFAESPGDLRTMFQATVLGCWVLALLTLADFRSAQTLAAGQIRFAAYGQDPNDVARFLDLGLPMAALLAITERRWAAKLAAAVYLPVGLLAVLLTASRGGFLAAVLAVAGCAFLMLRGRPRAFFGVIFALPVLAAAAWLAVPAGVIERLGTIPEQLSGGGLNQRFDIWVAGWRAFTHAPLLGSGIGTFVAAAGLSPIDTAHNTPLSILVAGGLCGLSVAVAIVFVSARSAVRTPGLLRIALVTSLAIWLATAMVSSVEESRFTWLLLAFLAVAERLALDEPLRLAACFPEPVAAAGQGSVAAASVQAR